MLNGSCIRNGRFEGFADDVDFVCDGYLDVGEGLDINGGFK